jgi:alpha-L-rhamnosidase
MRRNIKHADSPDKTIFSQHANIFGILSNTIPQPLQKKLIQRVVHDTSLIQSSVYFRFFLGQAFKKAGLSNEYLSLMDPWKDMLNEGLTTFAEVPGHARSDCHPWSSSPLYEFYSTVCGINPGTAGFGSIEIRPALGSLQWVKASIPHGNECIQLSLHKMSGNGIQGEIILPAKLQGYLTWNSKKILLKGGKNNVLIR